jgi:hypothetical protein
LSILSETPVILKDLFDLIAAEDRGHFDEMLKVVVSVPEDENAVAVRPSAEVKVTVEAVPEATTAGG